jgi:hypothetical protein
LAGFRNGAASPIKAQVGRDYGRSALQRQRIARRCVPRATARARRPCYYALQKASLTRRNSSEWVMLSEGRLFWLGPLEWSVLLISAALCGYLALTI